MDKKNAQKRISVGYFWAPGRIILGHKLSMTAMLVLGQIAYMSPFFQSRRKLAEILGVTPETISVVLSSLEKKGLINCIGYRYRRRVFVASDEVLEAFQLPKRKQINEEELKKKLAEEEELEQAEEQGYEVNWKEQHEKANEFIEKYEEKKKRIVTPQRQDAKSLDRLMDEIHTTLEGKHQIKHTVGRRSKLRARLRSFNEEDLLVAAQNLAQSEFHMGKNDQNMKYATLDFLIRNDEQVEKWLYSNARQVRTQRMLNNLWITS